MAIRKFSASSLTNANSKSSKLWDQETTLGTYESIATATVDSGNASTISFSNIPQNYTHLQIRGIGRSNGAGNNYGIILSMNSDTTVGNYRTHYLSAYGGGIAHGTTQSQGGVYLLNVIAGAGSLSNNIGAFIIDIFDYSNTSKNKTVRCIGGEDRNATDSGWAQLFSGFWMNTSAVTSIVLKDEATSWAQYSQFALYGIRSA